MWRRGKARATAAVALLAYARRTIGREGSTDPCSKLGRNTAFHIPQSIRRQWSVWAVTVRGQARVAVAEGGSAVFTTGASTVATMGQTRERHRRDGTSQHGL